MVALNNAPIIGLISGKVYFSSDGLGIFLFVLYCVFVGIYEELIFRGIIFPLVLIKTRKVKYGVFIAILISSLLFAAAHLLNLLSGAGILDTLLQMGYSFLIGGMCAISLCVTKNIFVAIFLHAVYDIGGLMTDAGIGICKGNSWDTATIVITAILGVIVFAFEIILALKLNVKDVCESFGIDNTEPENF